MTVIDEIVAWFYPRNPVNPKTDLMINFQPYMKNQPGNDHAVDEGHAQEICEFYRKNSFWYADTPFFQLIAFLF